MEVSGKKLLNIWVFINNSYKDLKKKTKIAKSKYSSLYILIFIIDLNKEVEGKSVKSYNIIYQFFQCKLTFKIYTCPSKA